MKLDCQIVYRALAVLLTSAFGLFVGMRLTDALPGWMLVVAAVCFVVYVWCIQDSIKIGIRRYELVENKWAWVCLIIYIILTTWLPDHILTQPVRLGLILMIWLESFPFYLVARRKILRGEVPLKPVPPPPGNTRAQLEKLTGQLENLVELRNQGVLSEQEFRTFRERVLN